MNYTPFRRFIDRLGRTVLASCLFIVGVNAQETEPPPGIIVHFSGNAMAGLQDSLPLSSATAKRWITGRAMALDIDSAAEARARISSLRDRSGHLAQTEMVNLAAKWQAFRAKMAELAALPGVSLVEPDYLGHFDGITPAPAPNDPEYSQQWWLAGIHATSLWALQSQRQIVVAVIDTGVDVNHPDMVNVYDSRGYSFGDNNTNVQDLFGHGAGTAGVIAANRGNGIGIAGVGVNVKILPLKVNTANSPTFRSSYLAQAIRYAVDNNVQVINLSLTVDEETQLVSDAIDYAQSRGALIIAAAGNQHDAPVAFPANKPGVIGVAASDQSGGLASFSSYGPTVTLAAPGANILSTAIGSGYAIYNGTSFAAPVVSGVVASALAINQGYPPASLASLLRTSTIPLTGGTYTFGNLDLSRFAAALTLQLSSSKTQYRTSEYLDLLASVPPTSRPVTFSLSVATPLGEFFLSPDNSWVACCALPVLFTDYVWTQPLAVPIFGNDGIFGRLPLAGLPPGNYEWHGRMVDQQAGSVVGTVSTLPITVLP